MRLLFLLSALGLSFVTVVRSHTPDVALSLRANGLVPTVDPTVYLVDGGAGTYPRLASLADGSVLGTVTTSSGGVKTLTVTRSTDGARTFTAWGTIAMSTGDLDNAFLKQLANGDIVATFRNHDMSDSTYPFYRVHNGMHLARQRAATTIKNGLWEPWQRIAKSGALQVYYSSENSAADQDILQSPSLETIFHSTNDYQENLCLTGATTMGRDGMPSCADFTASGVARVICIFETTEGTAPRFTVKSVVSTNDGASFGERTPVYVPTGTVTNAGAPFIVQTSGGTLVAAFQTDEDTAQQIWPDGASFKVLTSLSTDPQAWGQKTTVLPVQSLWGSLYSRVDGSSTVVACADNGGARCHEVSF
ncbi:glycoside hydrolase family 93 protein [Mycena sanguinolenta]|nr:glycoside hydrolase family 93 protein [Mycena sanguinolenta]